MALTLDPKRTALLALDLQNDIIGATPSGEKVLGTIRRVLDAGRQKQVPVVYITVSFREDYGDVPAASPLFQFIKQNGMLRATSEGAKIHPSVEPKAGELVLNKTCVNPFISTNLQQQLHNLDAKTLILMGFWTNQVVEATARYASDMGYEVVVVSDGCASDSDENHSFAIERILPSVGTVAGADEVLQALQ